VNCEWYSWACEEDQTYQVQNENENVMEENPAPEEGSPMYYYTCENNEECKSNWNGDQCIMGPGQSYGECGCQEDTDCGWPMVCKEGTCESLTCTNNEECAGTRAPTCWSWTWLNYYTGEEEISGYCVGCTQNSNCEADQVCYNIECQTECNPEESACQNGDSCQPYGSEGICVDCNGGMGWYCTWEEELKDGYWDNDNNDDYELDDDMVYP